MERSKKLVVSSNDKNQESRLYNTGIVIDDDQTIVNLLAEFLEIKGMKIIGKGYSGKDAVELYEELKPDFVFLDIMMPQFDGFYALERIKKLNKNAMVIMITADMSRDTTNKLEEFNVPYLYKPYEFEEIVKLIKKMSTSQ
jgi:two-component system chemotaxis response regulator CheY